MREITVQSGNAIVELTNYEYAVLLTALDGPSKILGVIKDELDDLYQQREATEQRMQEAKDNWDDYQAYAHSLCNILGPPIDMLEDILRKAA